MEVPNTTKPIIKKRCAFEGCKLKTAPIIGLCNYCESKYCLAHRLPETHVCPKMNVCKDIQFNRNKDKLLSEKCVAAKI